LIVIGFWPQPLLDLTNNAVAGLLEATPLQEAGP
jgi:hypothetical protein